MRVGVLYSAIALASAALAAPSGLQYRAQPGGHLAARSNSSTAGTKIILDNDWSTAGFLTYLMALNEGWDVLGIVGDTGDSWALQTSLHGLATLEVGGLNSCIPVYKGSDYPLVNTPELFQTWEDLHGDLAWVSIRESSRLKSTGEITRGSVADNVHSKALSHPRTPPTKLWATIQPQETRRGSSRVRFTRAIRMELWLATTPHSGWLSKYESTRERS